MNPIMIIKLIILALLASCHTDTNNEQLPNDLTVKGIKGKVKYIKSVIDSSIEETYYSEMGFKDSIIYIDGNLSTFEHYKRDENGRVLEEIKHENDSLISHHFYTYSNNFLNAEISDKNGKLGHIKLTSKGLEEYRSIKTIIRDQIWNIEILYDYDEKNQLITKKLITKCSESNYLDTTITVYSYDNQNLISSYTRTRIRNHYSDKEKSVNKINFDLKEFDPKGNWTQAKVEGEKQSYFVSREIEYYD